MQLIKKRHEQLVKACKAGDVATVQQLLSPGIDVNDMSSEVCIYIYIHVPACKHTCK